MSTPKPQIHTFLALREEGKPDRILVWDTQDISLGRSHENDLVIDQAEVSRQHSLFARAGDRYQVTNLSGSNGTLVNGQATQEQILQSKDVLRVGELQLQFMQTERNPASYGLEVEYSSQLKDFAPSLKKEPKEGQAAGVTMLGFDEAIEKGNARSQESVAASGECDLMDEDPAGVSATRDLDAELSIPSAAATGTTPVPSPSLPGRSRTRAPTASRRRPNSRRPRTRLPRERRWSTRHLPR